MKFITISDGYKLGHMNMYPKDLTKIYSVLSSRKGKYNPSDTHVVFGVTAMINKLQKLFSEFADQTEEEFLEDMKVLSEYGVKTPADKFSELRKLGYLPVKIKAVKEGTELKVGVPMLTIESTVTGFEWVVGFIETFVLSSIWHPCTSATTAKSFKNIATEFQEKTHDNAWFNDFQFHDFSMRGHTSPESAAQSGAAHLLFNSGTDTLSGIQYIKENYGEVPSAMSVLASEHSVMLASINSDGSELETYRRLIKQEGIVSLVSDTWDFWNVIDNILPALKDEIMAREGKIVCRPDSGSPYKILCGDEKATKGTSEYKGLIESLFDLFGGHTNEKGYKELSEKIGAIYGDAITKDLSIKILKRLQEKGFASCNIVFGVGAYSYQGVTRDTFGFSFKSSYCEISGKPFCISKSPKTDTGKKSINGKVVVTDTDNYEHSLLDDKGGLLKTVFNEGTRHNELSFKETKQYANN